MLCAGTSRRRKTEESGLLALVLWGNLFASLGLTNLALLRDSWRLMAVPALLSFQFSFLAILSIGPFTILLTCLQVGAAVAISRGYGGRGWLLSLGAGLEVWLLLVGSVLFLSLAIDTKHASTLRQ